MRRDECQGGKAGVEDAWETGRCNKRLCFGPTFAVIVSLLSTSLMKELRSGPHYQALHPHASEVAAVRAPFIPEEPRTRRHQPDRRPRPGRRSGIRQRR